ncbi:MAG: hypothetical protein J5524_09180 [Bacteroidaceae bacterium]|nr:hypothetical protein [Bacteroidaceae bacterium]MBO4841253.1 hypothetical protein [Bacteroidaceae bacterium]
MLIETKLVNYLAFKVAMLPNSGLFHGRMGVILALYCYGVVHDNRILCDYVSNILQDANNDYFDGDTSIENGLAGLGLGFTLLYKAGMYQDDLNDLLSDIDKRIMSVDPRRIDDYSFRKGAPGIYYYIKTRQNVGQECISIHKDYIEELEANIQAHFYGENKMESLMGSLKQPTWKTEDYLEKDCGIDNGCAYFLLKDSYDKVFSR